MYIVCWASRLGLVIGIFSGVSTVAGLEKMMKESVLTSGNL